MVKPLRRGKAGGHYLPMGWPRHWRPEVGHAKRANVLFGFVPLDSAVLLFHRVLHALPGKRFKFTNPGNGTSARSC